MSLFENMTMHPTQSTEEYIVPNAGLSLLATMMQQSRLSDIVNRFRTSALKGMRSGPQFTDDEIVMVYALMIADGSTSFDSIDNLEGEKDFIARILNISADRIPSSSIIRQRLNVLAEYPRLLSDLACESISLLRRYGMLPTPIQGYVPLDFDVTPFDNSKSHKEGVSRTYKQFDGYAPMMAYIGAEGYLIEAELREGKQHSQKGTLDLLKRVVERARHLTAEPLMIRMDSGNDARENIAYLEARRAAGDEGIAYIVKRNLRRENPGDWHEYAVAHATSVECPRVGKLIYTGSRMMPVSVDMLDGSKAVVDVRVVYQVTERTIIAKTGQICLIPQIEVDTYWTSSLLNDQDVIQGYHNHAVMEQFHSEIKTDMDVERLPSHRFATNALVLAIAGFVYNLERMLGQESLKVAGAPVNKKTMRLRLRNVLLHLIHMPARIVRSGRGFMMKISNKCTWHKVFIQLEERFRLANRFTRPQVA